MEGLRFSSEIRAIQPQCMVSEITAKVYTFRVFHRKQTSGKTMKKILDTARWKAPEAMCLHEGHFGQPDCPQTKPCFTETPCVNGEKHCRLKVAAYYLVKRLPTKMLLIGFSIELNRKATHPWAQFKVKALNRQCNARPSFLVSMKNEKKRDMH